MRTGDAVLVLVMCVLALLVFAAFLAWNAGQDRRLDSLERRAGCLEADKAEAAAVWAEINRLKSQYQEMLSENQEPPMPPPPPEQPHRTIVFRSVSPIRPGELLPYPTLPSQDCDEHISSEEMPR